jgi:hypothetical protein
MRRMVIAVTALLCLAFAGTAAAASTVAPTASNNGYTAGFKLSGGTKKSPGVTMVETLGTTAPTGFGAPYPLADILTKVSGISSPYLKYFPKCTIAQINAAASDGTWNGVCPKGSQVAVGTVVSTITPSTTTSSTLSATPLADPCTLTLHVYNAGSGNLAYFFTVADNACGPLGTGDALPYPGTAFEKSGGVTNNVPEDANISFDAGNTGDWGALLSETLKWGASVKVHGKSYPYLVDTGCKKTSKWSAAFAGTNDTDAATSPTEIPPTSDWLPTVTVSGSNKC